jgi:hypothetical protein
MVLVAGKSVNNTTKQVKPIPEDIREVISMLCGIRDELPDLFASEFNELYLDLKVSIRRWFEDGCMEPDWEYFREEINRLCEDDGMPMLFDRG